MLAWSQTIRHDERDRCTTATRSAEAVSAGLATSGAVKCTDSVEYCSSAESLSKTKRLEYSGLESDSGDPEPGSP